MQSVQAFAPETMEEGWDRLSRQLRASMGVGRDKFARLLQVTPRTVMRWENGQGPEKVVPQGIQRMKLLALSLDARAPEQQQETLSVMLEQAANLRATYERKATNIKFYGVELEAQPPAWFDDLLKLKQKKNWSAMLLMGPHFLPAASNGNGGLAEPTLEPTIEAMVSLWIGIAAFMEGYPHKAIEFYAQGLTARPIPQVLHCVLLSNEAYALIRLRKFEQAEQKLDVCLQIDPAHRGALRNKIVLHSHTGDEAAAVDASMELLRHFPEAAEPDSELGGLVREDPDLSGFRDTESFSRAFPNLVA